MRLALVHPLAESSTAVRLLVEHGYTVRVTQAGPGGADVILPASRGGSLAFVLHSGAVVSTAVAERAAQASRAARRCTLLVLCNEPDLDAVEALQNSCPAGVNVAICSTHQEAAEHMLDCAQHAAAAAASGAADDVGKIPQEAAERPTAQLAALWDADRHSVEFLLATRPLSSLARVTSQQEWEDLVLETDALIDRDLLYTAIDWLQHDTMQLW